MSAALATLRSSLRALKTERRRTRYSAASKRCPASSPAGCGAIRKRPTPLPGAGRACSGAAFPCPGSTWLSVWSLPRRGPLPPRDHLSLSAWDWEGSQDRGQSAGPTTSPSRFPENLPQRPAPSDAHTEGPSPCPCVQEHEGPGHSRHLLGPVGVQCDASPTVPGDPSRTLLGPPPQLTPAPHPRGRSAVLQAGHPA